MLRSGAGARRFALLLAAAAGAGALSDRARDCSSATTVRASLSPPLRQALADAAAGILRPAAPWTPLPLNQGSSSLSSSPSLLPPGML
jgi:hypothetical protein